MIKGCLESEETADMVYFYVSPNETLNPAGKVR